MWKEHQDIVLGEHKENKEQNEHYWSYDLIWVKIK